MAEFLADRDEIRDKLQQIQQRGDVEPAKADHESGEKVSEAFILSVKSAAKPGIRLTN